MILKVERAWVDGSWWGLFSEPRPWKWIPPLLMRHSCPEKTETESTELGALRERCFLWLRTLMLKRKSHSYGGWKDSGCCSGRWACSAGWRLLSSPPLIITNIIHACSSSCFNMLASFTSVYSWDGVHPLGPSLCSQLLGLCRSVVNLPWPSFCSKEKGPGCTCDFRVTWKHLSWASSMPGWPWMPRCLEVSETWEMAGGARSGRDQRTKPFSPCPQWSSSVRQRGSERSLYGSWDCDWGRGKCGMSMEIHVNWVCMFKRLASMLFIKAVIENNSSSRRGMIKGKYGPSKSMVLAV